MSTLHWIGRAHCDTCEMVFRVVYEDGAILACPRCGKEIHAEASGDEV